MPLVGLIWSQNVLIFFSVYTVIFAMILVPFSILFFVTVDRSRNETSRQTCGRLTLSVVRSSQWSVYFHPCFLPLFIATKQLPELNMIQL